MTRVTAAPRGPARFPLHCAGRKSSRGSRADIKPSHRRPGCSPSPGLNEAINPGRRREGRPPHMSRRPDRGRHLGLAGTERPDTPSLIPHARPPPPRQQPIHLPRRLSSPASGPLLSVKMSPGSRGLFLFIFGSVPLRPSLRGAAPVLRTGPQDALLPRLPFPPPPGKAQRRPAAAGPFLLAAGHTGRAFWPLALGSFTRAL